MAERLRPLGLAAAMVVGLSPSGVVAFGQIADEPRLLWVPEGFAHGFSVQTETAEVQYKCSDFYSPADERGLMWNDPALGIDWHLDGEPVLSAKDQKYPDFANIQLD